MSRLRIHLSIWLIIPLLGCVYYNTFHNARKYYDQAERTRMESESDGLSQATGQLYDKAIEKAAKVVVFYSQSEWVDDALLLMGKAFYRKGEYPKAIRKFRELLTNYSESNLVDKAYFWLGMSYKAASKPGKAEEVFRRIAKERGNERAGDAKYMLGEALFAQDDYLSAIDEYKQFLEDFPESRYRAKAQYMIGECFYRLKRYEQAQAEYERVLANGPDHDLQYEAIYRCGQCLVAQGQYEPAIRVFQELLQDERNYERFAPIRLEIAMCKRKMGDYREAIAEYSGIAQDYPNTEFSAEALFSLGLIYQEVYFDFEKAAKNFEEVAKQSVQSKLGEEATARIEDINKLITYRSRLSQEGQDQAKTRFLLAELYLFQFSQVDSALVQYQAVLNQYPKSEHAPKAIYAIAWILAEVKGDSLGAEELYWRLIQDYPATEYADAARAILGIDDPKGNEISPKAELLRAERRFLQGEEVDMVLEGYRRVVEAYPTSEYAPKAQYAIAWIWENIKKDRQMAINAYRKLASDYPDTEYATLAKRKLGLAKGESSSPSLSEIK